MKDTAYLLALHSIDGLGPIRLKKVLDYFNGDFKLAWESTHTELKEIGIPQPTIDRLIGTRKNLEPDKYQESIDKSGIKYMSVFDETYPKRLKQIYDPPTILYYKGEILPIDSKAIAVVGTRKVTG